MTAEELKGLVQQLFSILPLDEQSTDKKVHDVARQIRDYVNGDVKFIVDGKVYSLLWGTHADGLTAWTLIHDVDTHPLDIPLE